MSHSKSTASFPSSAPCAWSQEQVPHELQSKWQGEQQWTHSFHISFPPCWSPGDVCDLQVQRKEKKTKQTHTHTPQRKRQNPRQLIAGVQFSAFEDYQSLPETFRFLEKICVDFHTRRYQFHLSYFVLPSQASPCPTDTDKYVCPTTYCKDGLAVIFSLCVWRSKDISARTLLCLWVRKLRAGVSPPRFLVSVSDIHGSTCCGFKD